MNTLDRITLRVDPLTRELIERAEHAEQMERQTINATRKRGGVLRFALKFAAALIVLAAVTVALFALNSLT